MLKIWDFKLNIPEHDASFLSVRNTYADYLMLSIGSNTAKRNLKS